MAANMSERDLLLLSNFMYISGDQQPGTDMKTAIEATLRRVQSGKPIGGGISRGDAEIMLNDMLNSPNITQLRVAKHDTNIQAMCLEVPGTTQAVVAFQGTGGDYYRWKDNAVGTVEVDTSYRQGVERFAADCSQYTDITTTGHSKGGHGAEHFAVVSPSNVSRVVSYDGYGGSPEYAAKYSNEIAQVRDRITAINGDNDYVQGIDGDFAGERFFVKGAGHDFSSYHCSGDLYFAAKYDEHGNIMDSSKQATQSATGAKATQLVNMLINDVRSSGLSPEVKGRSMQIIGMILGVFLSKNRIIGVGELMFELGKAALYFGLSRKALIAIIALVFKRRKEISAFLKTMKEEAKQRKPVARESKVPRHRLVSKEAHAAIMRNPLAFVAALVGSSKTTYAPESLDQAMQSLGKLSRELSQLAGQVQSSRRFSSWRLSSYKLSGSVSCTVRAPGISGVRAGQLSTVLSSYVRLLNAYGDEIAKLSRAVAEAKDVFESTEKELVSMAQSLLVE